MREQLAEQPVTMGEMPLLCIFEGSQQLARLHCVVPSLLQFDDYFTLTGDMTLTERDMLLSLREVLLQHRLVHASR